MRKPSGFSAPTRGQSLQQYESAGALMPCLGSTLPVWFALAAFPNPRYSPQPLGIVPGRAARTCRVESLVCLSAWRLKDGPSNRTSALYRRTAVR
jgi:hypothetical protein